MSPRKSDNTSRSFGLWVLVAALVLSAAALPVMADSASAADAHIAIKDINVSTKEPAPGQQTTIRTTIQNGENSPSIVEVTDVYVRRPKSSEDLARVEDVGTVTIGGEMTVPLTVSFEEPGTKNLRVIVTGRQSDGSYTTVRYPLTVDVTEPKHPQLELTTEKAVVGATRSVNVTVANGLERDIRQVRVVPSAKGVNFSVDERVKARLRSENTSTFSFPARVTEAGSYAVNVTLYYSDRGVQHRVTRTYQTQFEAPSNPGEIVLTDLQATQRGGTVEISATAGNVGSSAVEGVVVSVPGSQRVDQSTYFVGSIDGSDFSSFTLNSDVSGNISTVPVEVRYSIGGVQRSFTREVSVDRSTVSQQSTGSGGLPLLPVGAVAAVALVSIVGYLWWR